jgi:hypothetical protein
MLITRCRQLPDGEELVWAEETTASHDNSFDPRESALARRGLAMTQRIIRTEPRQSSDHPPSTSLAVRPKVEVGH